MAESNVDGVAARPKVLSFPDIPPATVPIDLDSPEEWAPNLSYNVVASDSCNDKVYLKTENVPGGRQLRAQFFSDDNHTAGLLGRKDRGWSWYSIVLTEGGEIFAQKMIDGAKGAYETTRYSLNGLWEGAAERVAQLVAEAVAGWEVSQRLRSPSDVARNPYYALALWLDNNRDAAWHTIPHDLLQPILQRDGIEASVDIDQVEDFPPSLGAVSVTPHTTYNWVRTTPIRMPDPEKQMQGEEGVETVLEVQLGSEVTLPELGRKREKAGVKDNPAPRRLALTFKGIRIGDGTQWNLFPVIDKERLPAIVAGALVAVGTVEQPVTLARKIAESAGKLESPGEKLPVEDQVVAGAYLRNVLRAFSDPDGNVRSGP